MKVREVMTPYPITLASDEPVMKAAQAMRENDIGNVVVRHDGKLCGIVTDRDIVVRVLAAGKDPQSTTLDAVCSHDMLTLSPDQDTSDAIRLMRERAIRRLPVVENNNLLGIVSLGDLAVALDPHSTLSDISVASPSH